MKQVLDSCKVGLVLIQGTFKAVTKVALLRVDIQLVRLISRSRGDTKCA